MHWPYTEKNGYSLAELESNDGWQPKLFYVYLMEKVLVVARFTDALIDRIQTYYGYAIRNNKHD